MPPSVASRPIVKMRVRFIWVLMSDACGVQTDVPVRVNSILSQRRREIAVPRYVLERDLGVVSEEEMGEIAARSKLTAIEEFPDITWEHSHVCAAEDGKIKSFCVYAAPSPERLQEHADSVGGMMITSIYEIVGDLTPGEVKL
jgi:Protein of unknown function (DUF4242)